MLRSLIATAALFALSGCVSAVVANDVPSCERMIPPGLLEDTPPADMPENRKLPDGHDDAQPWQAGFVEQTGQLEIANTRAPAVDHIYRECLRMHAERLKKDTRGFLGRVFGGS
jgi:hypothetical protein